jgi:hypothetical protein
MEDLNHEEKMVLLIIQEHTKENTIFDGQIREKINIADPANKCGAGLRTVINSLRQKGYAICSDTNGYWYAQSKQEILDNAEALKGRALKILEAVTGMQKAAERYGEMQATLQL